MFAPALPVDPRAYPAPVTRALAPVAAVAIVAATADPAERDFIATLAGRTVTALVIGRSDNGRAIVSIGGRQVAVNAALPAPGSPVRLSFGEAEPAVAVADLAHHAAPAAPAAAPPGLRAALQATRELREAGGSGPVPAAAGASSGNDTIVELKPQALGLGRLAASSAEPLQLGRVAAPIAAPADWAKALATLVQDSGAFYESHLAAWTQGQYPLAQIRQEPQAAIAPAGSAAAAPPPAAPPADNPAHPAAAITVPGGAVAGLPDEWRPVVREQLHTLESRALPFAVEAWPGQRADIVIAGEREARSPAGTENAPAWNTTLRLALPRLGGIDAALTLRGDRLWLELAASAASADELDAASSALASAMAAAGLQMARVRVRDQAAPPAATGQP